MTQTGQFVGSLPWASPEQAEGIAGIDTRTDVYSLGVILFQLLTGRFPYDVFGPLREVLDHISRAQPIDPRSIRREIDDDVRTIVLKCLQKDPARRYQSAGELAADIRRYLTGRPIEAKRDSLGYVIRKLIWRNRAAAAAAFLFVLLIAAFAITAEVQSSHIAHERNAALAEARKAQRIQSFLQSMFAAIDPDSAANQNVTMRQALDAAVPRVEREFADMPEAQAAILDTIGTTYSNLGIYDQAEAALRRSLQLRRELYGNMHADVAETLAHLADTLHDRRRLDAAEAPARESLAIRLHLFGPNSEPAAASMSALANLLFDMHRDLPQVDTAARDALKIQRQLGENRTETAVAMSILGRCLVMEQKFDEARPLLQQSLAITRRLKGNDHPEVAGRLTHLAELLDAVGDKAGASVALSESIAIRRARIPDHPALAWNLLCLSELKLDQNDLLAAESLCREALSIQTRHSAAANTDIADCQYLLARILLARSDPASAEPLLQECLATRIRDLPPEHWLIPATRTMLAECLITQRKFEAARPILDTADHELEQCKATRQENITDTRVRWSRLMKACDDNDRTQVHAVNRS